MTVRPTPTLRGTVVTEAEFVDVFEATARKVLGKKAIVKKGFPLFYELYLDRRLEVARSPAFATDLCIAEMLDDVLFPRIVIEIKNKPTTHDVLAYSAKAHKHKQVYPWLRYGLLVYGEPHVAQRFFVHNEHLDFYVAAGKYSSPAQLTKLAKGLIEKELRVSRTLEAIQFDRRKVDYYCRDIIFEPFGE
jgi:hypothetical protein